MRAARASAPVLARLAGVVAGEEPKLVRGVRGRREAPGQLAAWGERARDPARPGIWLHAPSVGEGLVAQAVLAAVRVRQPGLQVAFTHFSPSAEELAGRIGADVAAYLPWDVAEPVRHALDALRPDLLVFTKTEVWPVLVDEAARRGVAVALVGAVLPRGAGRMRWPARPLLRSTWSRLALAGAVSDADAAGLVALGVPEAAVRVTGDPGIDSAIGRLEEADAAAPYLAPFHEEPRPTLVAGSTWPEDEAVLIPALDIVRRAVPDVRVIFAPHEPTADAVGGLLTRLQGLGWKCRSLAAVESRGSPGDAAAVVIDRVGVLAHMYTVAGVAYVGGGFGARGLHSVLEPAAAGAPVTFGPRHERAPAAAGLLDAGGARIAEDAETLAAILSEWLLDAPARHRASGAALAYIGRHRGAADRTAALLAPFFEPTPEHL
ncbi:MAG TPA: glycosyltransferase N-terminal domain-containing protein [Longimicrobiales bacterium]|nr:glycosyltransferase N-terminal domain-containing protein [Longimicrobiales bacterium]